MARAFTSGQYLTVASVPVTAVPLTLAAWVKPAAVAADQCFLALENSASNVNFFKLMYRGAGGGVSANHRSTASGGSEAFSSALSAGAMQHVCAVFETNSSRSAYMNGGAKGTNTAANSTPSSINLLSIGRANSNGTPEDFFVGDAAEFVIWGAALTDSEVAALGARVSPLLVRPAALLFYARLAGVAAPEPEVIGRRDLTVSGATLATHPALADPIAQWTPTGRHYVISGVTKDRAGLVLPACTVKLFRTSDDALTATTLSDASTGAFSFGGLNTVAYYVVAYKAGSPDVAGTTVNTLVGV